MRNELAWPQQCWKSCANGSNIVALRFSDHGTKEMLGVVAWKVWPVSNFLQQHATTSKNMQQGVQTDATCNIQQCWELLANNVASICTGLQIVGENTDKPGKIRHARTTHYRLGAWKRPSRKYKTGRDGNWSLLLSLWQCLSTLSKLV